MEILKEIDKIITEIKSCSEVDAIYLFGSHAAGKAKPTSDIDICVIAQKDIPKKIKEEIMANSSKKIDLVMFWELPPVIRFRVIRDGKLLYVRDTLTLHRARVETLKSYLDFEPVIRRHYKRVLGV